jgi:Major coat protein-like
MKLTSMKISKAEREARYSTLAAPQDAPSYPYGLELRLDDEALGKLDLTELPEVETTVMVWAKCTVTAVSATQSEGSEMRRSLTLQVTDLAIEEASTPAAEKMYGAAS